MTLLIWRTQYQQENSGTMKPKLPLNSTKIIIFPKFCRFLSYLNQLRILNTRYAPNPITRFDYDSFLIIPEVLFSIETVFRLHLLYCESILESTFYTSNAHLAFCAPFSERTFARPWIKLHTFPLARQHWLATGSCSILRIRFFYHPVETLCSPTLRAPHHAWLVA